MKVHKGAYASLLKQSMKVIFVLTKQMQEMKSGKPVGQTYFFFLSNIYMIYYYNNFPEDPVDFKIAELFLRTTLSVSKSIFK